MRRRSDESEASRDGSRRILIEDGPEQNRPVRRTAREALHEAVDISLASAAARRGTIRMKVRIVTDREELTADLPCALTMGGQEVSITSAGSAREIVRLTGQQGAVYMVSRSQDTLVDGRRALTGLAKLTPGSHRIVVDGVRVVVDVPAPSIRVVGVEEHPLEDCPVHHGPPSGRVAVCEKCGFVCCAECGSRRCPRCGLAGTNGS